MTQTLYYTHSYLCIHTNTYTYVCACVYTPQNIIQRWDSEIPIPNIQVNELMNGVPVLQSNTFIPAVYYSHRNSCNFWH